jgi:hypothetical protein
MEGTDWDLDELMCAFYLCFFVVVVVVQGKALLGVHGGRGIIDRAGHGLTNQGYDDIGWYRAILLVFFFAFDPTGPEKLLH